VEVSRTIISKFILITGLFAACIANAQSASPTPAASTLSMQGTPSGLSAYSAGTVASGTTQATSPTIYGGYAGDINGCSGSPASTSTCDSCAGGTTLAACNPTSIHPNLLLTVTLVPVASSLTGTPRVRWKFSGETSGHAINNTPTLTAGQPFTAQIPWSQLCSAAGTNDGTCKTDITTALTLSIGIDTDNADGTLEQKVDFNFVFRYVTAADRLTASCPANVTNNAVATEGICDYTLYRGDQKVYLLEYAAGSNDLTTANPAVKYNRIAMFYVKNAASSTITTSATPLILNLNNNSPSEPTVSDPRITGLENDVKYCFALGNMDETGNITYFPTVADLVPANDAKFCATPSQVVGLLDDKHCFIATATFGSTMAPEVQTFRDFRNQYLLNNSFGKSLVKFYYAWGPEAAEWISHSELLRTLSLWVLWPMLLFVKLCLAWGLLPASFIALATVILLKKSITALWQRRQLKGAV
jgi:hypothetical protein